MSLFDWLTDNAGTLGSIGALAGGFQQAANLENMGVQSQQEMYNLGELLNGMSQWQGYGVTSPFGTTTVNGLGSVDFGVNPNQALLDASNSALANIAAGGGGGGYGGGAYSSYGGGGGGGGFGKYSPMYHQYAMQAIEQSLADPSQRQDEIYQAMMDIQNPQLDAMQAAQIANEHAMGRGGVMGSQFGGTAEDAAMARARTQASREAVVDAMNQTNEERSLFSQMGSNYGNLGNTQDSIAQSHAAAQMAAAAQKHSANMSYKAAKEANALKAAIAQQEFAYLPMEMQLEIAKLAQGNSDLAQTGQLTGADLFGKLALGGLNANMAGQTASSNLTAQLYAALLNNASSGGSSGDGFFKDLLDMLGIGG